MIAVKCVYMGLEYVGTKAMGTETGYNLTSPGGQSQYCVDESSLTNIVKLTDDENSISSNSLLASIGAKPCEITIKF